MVMVETSRPARECGDSFCNVLRLICSSNLTGTSYQWEEATPYLETNRFPGHAQEFETAFAMAAFPENVRHDAMQNQEDKEPLHASVENGQALIEIAINNVAKFLEDMMAGTEIAEIPEFHP